MKNNYERDLIVSHLRVISRHIMGCIDSNKKQSLEKNACENLTVM